MSESLIKLRSCCGQLASDKISERKKQVDVFKKELGRPSVCRQLDENSRNGRGMIWEHCFEAVREFMIKEVAHVRNKLASGKGSPDHRKLLSTANIFKWFVQKANNTGEHLKLATLVEHVLILIKDETSVLCYGTECCMVVSREILNSWSYSSRLITKNWQDFLKHFCLSLRDPPPGISLDLLTQLVHQLFAGAVQNSNIRKGIFFNFFKQIIEKCRSSEFSSTMINAILCSMNTFCLYAAGDCRKQVCGLGEEITSTLLHIWKAQHLTAKAAIVEFLCLQMRVHHPKGALSEADGAMAINLDHWKGLIQKIYEVLYVEWTQQSNKLKLKGLGAKEIKVNSSLVELAADVCHQVFAGSQELVVPDGFEPLSQSSTPKRKNVAGPNPVKRRKLESGWKMLRDHMTQAGQSQSIIPWLQLVEALLQKYPEALPADEIPEFLSVFVQLQSDCKRGEIHAQLLLCLEALALCQINQSPQKTPGMHPTGPEWEKVWAATVRSIGLRTTEREVFSLLTTLLVHKLVSPGQEVWKLFSPSISHPSQYSVGFLSVLLTNTFLPEKHTNELRPNSDSEYPLRQDLMEWLLSSLETSDVSESMKPTSSITMSVPSDLFSAVLCSLIFKSPKAVLPRDHSSVLHSDEISRISEVEELYLCSSFDGSNAKGDNSDASLCPKEPALTLLPLLMQLLIRKMTEACRNYQQLDFSETSTLHPAIQFSAVVVKVVTILVAKDVLPLDDPSVSQITRSIESLLNQISESVKTSVSNLVEANKDEVLQSFQPAIKSLADTFTWSSGHPLTSDKERKAFSDVIQCSASADLLDVLMGFVVNKGIKKKDQAGSSSIHHGGTIDDFDDEFDVVASLRSKTDSEEDEFAVHQSSMSMNPDADGGEFVGKHLVTLSITEQFCLSCCHALAQCCGSLCTEYSAENQGINNAIVKNELSKKLLQSLQEEKWEPKPPTAGLQMVFGTTSILLKSDNHLEPSLLLLILNILRSVASTYRRDQDTCCKILETIKLLIPRLQTEDGRISMEMMSARELTLYLMKAFWTLLKEGHYSARVRYSFVEALYALLVVDPESQWALLKLKEKGQGDAEREEKIRDILVTQLTDCSHFVRVQVAKNMKSFFYSSHGDLLTKEAQNVTFDLLYETLQSGMTLKGKMSVVEQADESSNRTSTLLVGLCCIARHSPASLRKVVFALIQAVKVNGLETQTVQKVVDEIWRHWCYEDSLSFMNGHLGFLVDMWLQLDYNLVEFPYQLLKCDTLTEFYRSYHKVLVPYLALANKMDALKSIAESLREDWSETLRASIPCTIAFILPCFINKDDPPGNRKHNATLCLDMLHKTFSKKVLETTIQENLASIVVELLTRFHEPYSEDSRISAYLRPTDPEPNSPHFSVDVILATLDYLAKCHSNSGSLSLVLLLSKSQDGLQKILHDLHSHVDLSHTMDDKHRGLLAYHLFVTVILDDLKTGLGNSWMFVLRTVVNMLLQTVRELLNKAMVSEVERSTHDRCLRLLVDTLHAVCEKCLELCDKELTKYLQVIIEVLASLLSSAARRESLNLINLLVVKSSDILADSLKDIDPLPDLPDLQSAKDVLSRMKDGDVNLLDEMSMFVMKEKIHSAGGLANLKRLISERKDELAVLIGQCKDEGSEALVPRVICTLVKLCTESHDEKIRQQAAACLGEIGAPNMSLIALQSVSIKDSMCYSTAAKVYSDDSKGCRNAILIHLLNQNLVQLDVDTIQAAATCLKRIFSTPSGLQFYEDYKSKNIDDLLNYLHPFKPNKKRISGFPASIHAEDVILSGLDDLLLWQPSKGASHDQWVRHLAVGLIQCGAVQDDMLRLMEPVCAVRAAFAESVLPYLIHDILLTADEARSAILSSQIGGLLSRVCESSDTKSSRAVSPHLNREMTDIDPKVGQKCVQTILAVVHYLRTQEKPTPGRHQKSNPWNNNFWLDVNYLLLAKAAQLCKAHFTCLLYTEIWYNVNRSQHEHLQDSSESQGGSQHSLDTLSSNSEINVQMLLLEAYTSIGEPDGLYGCGVSRMTDQLARIHTYEHEGDWTSAVSGYDLLNSDAGDPSSKAGLLQALQNAGLSHVLQTYLKGVKMETDAEADPSLSEAQYEAAWRNGIWDIPEQASEVFSGFHNSLYGALSAVRDKDQPLCFDALERGRCFVSESLHRASLESIHSVYPLLAQLQALKEMEEIQDLAFGKRSFHSILSRWNNHQRSIETSFDFTEMTFKLRLVGLTLLRDRCPESAKPAISRGLSDQLTLYAKAATSARRFQIAEKSLATMKSFESSLQSESLQWKRRLLEAEMFWAKSETSTALHLVKALIEKLSKLSAQHDTYKRIYPEALTLYGKWLAESRTESPHIIIENYLEKAVDICEVASSSRTTSMTAYLTLARFADAQYQHIVNYMKSPEFESKKGILNKYRNDVEQLTVMGDSKTRYYRNLLKQGDLDESEMASLLQDKSHFLNTSVKCYLKYLEASSAELDIPVFRLCSLWFNNPTDNSINSLLQEYIKKLPSSKFLPMLYQLAARMTTKTLEKEKYHSILQQLIEKTAQDHPYHTLPIILALSNANKDVTMTCQKKGGRLSRNTPQVSDASHADQDRMEAAAQMVERLRSGRTARIIRDMEKLSDAYIELAYWDVTQYKKVTKPISFPPNLQLCTLKNLQTAVATVDIPVDSSCCYDNVITVNGFESTFKLAGGINLPKIIRCTGSDGVKRRQLVKGKDDLRQDAVMQQVFGLVNHLLAQNPETRQRQLHIRRYKVVPLSQRSGILEWCEGTMPLGLYLLGDQKTDFGAHGRYRPGDKNSLQCRKIIQEAHSGDGSSRYRTYLKVCASHFKPVFRHFFFEKFLEPAVWFEKRLAYSRSAATCSIVGYVVGLGDRHVQNILIDCNTAELVHIDLGVAFEQGRILPTPETIPFRLTRDLVDGMGVAGVEGVFRRCCEKTMVVMRDNQEALLAVLEVLLYDPLYDWTMSPMKALALQKQQDKLEAEGETNTSATIGNVSFSLDQMDHGKSRHQLEQNTQVNAVAERALLRLRQKLQGLEEGVTLSVSGQINHLIQEARDPKNLCRVFPGWQPWV